jgi:hypothetical protein
MSILTELNTEKHLIYLGAEACNEYGITSTQCFSLTRLIEIRVGHYLTVINAEDLMGYNIHDFGKFAGLIMSICKRCEVMVTFYLMTTRDSAKLMDMIMYITPDSIIYERNGTRSTEILPWCSLYVKGLCRKIEERYVTNDSKKLPLMIGNYYWHTNKNISGLIFIEHESYKRYGIESNCMHLAMDYKFTLDIIDDDIIVNKSFHIKNIDKFITLITMIVNETPAIALVTIGIKDKIRGVISFEHDRMRCTPLTLPHDYYLIVKKIWKLYLLRYTTRLYIKQNMKMTIAISKPKLADIKFKYDN